MCKELVLFLAVLALAGALSLDELKCRRNPTLCNNGKEKLKNSTKFFLSDLSHRIPDNFDSWKLYGTESDDGTGYGPGVGPNFGPGLGTVGIGTGLGIANGVGGLVLERDIGVGFGGSGRVGGRVIGFGNGMGANGLGTSLGG